MRNRASQRGRHLLEIALAVRMMVNGSLQRPQSEQEDDLRCLLEALESWVPPASCHERFDNAVKELIEAALAETEA